MKYGYCRISTVKQDKNSSLEEQEREIKEMYPDAIIVREIYSGAKKRNKFESLIENLKPGDMVICTKMDRFCRTAKEGLQYVDEIREKGASIHIFNIGLIDDTPTGRLIATIFFAFAEFERAQIVERTQIGKEAAKQRPGFRDGRKPKFSRDQINHALGLLEYNSYSQVERMTGISVSTLVRAKRKQKSIQK